MYDPLTGSFFYSTPYQPLVGLCLSYYIRLYTQQIGESACLRL
jgi:hypothetical protein